MGQVVRAAQVAVRSPSFDDDLLALTSELGFRIDAIQPADAPTTAIVSGHGVRLRLERSAIADPVRLHLLSDDATGTLTLPGGSIVEFRPFTTTYDLPPNQPRLTISRLDGSSAPGRAGMRYRDLLPDRWGGRFIVSHITMLEGGPVPDYVHFHKIRFQMIFVRAGWVEVVYEDQGEPFVMRAGDGVLQPPEIRHRVLESSPGLEVIEIGCPAEHETIADHSVNLPTGRIDRDRDFGGQRFVRHIAAGAAYEPWRVAGWECRDTGIGAATDGLAGVRVARPTVGATADAIRHETEFSMLAVLSGAVVFAAAGHDPVRLDGAASVAIPGGLRYRLVDATDDCELLDVTLPAQFDVQR